MLEVVLLNINNYSFSYHFSI